MEKWEFHSVRDKESLNLVLNERGCLKYMGDKKTQLGISGQLFIEADAFGSTIA